MLIISCLNTSWPFSLTSEVHLWPFPYFDLLHIKKKLSPKDKTLPRKRKLQKEKVRQHDLLRSGLFILCQLSGSQKNWDGSWTYIIYKWFPSIKSHGLQIPHPHVSGRTLKVFDILPTFTHGTLLSHATFSESLSFFQQKVVHSTSRVPSFALRYTVFIHYLIKISLYRSTKLSNITYKHVTKVINSSKSDRFKRAPRLCHSYVYAFTSSCNNCSGNPSSSLCPSTHQSFNNSN